MAVDYNQLTLCSDGSCQAIDSVSFPLNGVPESPFLFFV